MRAYFVKTNRSGDCSPVTELFWACYREHLNHHTTQKCPKCGEVKNTKNSFALMDRVIEACQKKESVINLHLSDYQETVKAFVKDTACLNVFLKKSLSQKSYCTMYTDDVAMQMAYPHLFSGEDVSNFDWLSIFENVSEFQRGFDYSLNQIMAKAFQKAIPKAIRAAHLANHLETQADIEAFQKAIQ